jgi:hypothetical protein
MAELIEPLEYLAGEGIRINFGRDVSSLLVGYGEINKSYVYIGPGEESGVIGVCYEKDKIRGKSNLRYINSSGHDSTQICFNSGGLFTICHTKNELNKFLNNSFSKVSVEDYIERIEDELGFFF